MITKAQQNRYYPSERFPNTIPNELKEESRLQWDALYSLKDQKWDVQEFTLTENRGMNLVTFTGKPLLTILIQDQVGGWVVSWPAKFRDWANLNLDTTANTYTTILWYPMAEDKVIAVGGMTGGIL
jgi:hypothetical protein